MGIKVLILGESGTGKSTSLRNFTKDELFLVNVANKTLPFKGKFESVNGDSYREIKKAIANTNKKSIVIDDSQYLMANEFMRRATEKGFDKFTEIAQNYWELIQAVDKLPEDTITYIISHVDKDQNGNEKIKTIGRLLDEKITIEGMFTIVLKTTIQDGKYYFQTQNSGHDTCKSPIGLFDNFLIPNDLKEVDKLIRNYYELSTEPTNIPEKFVKELEDKGVDVSSLSDVEVVEQPKSLAEKLADFQNKEPHAAPVETADATPVRRRRRV